MSSFTLARATWVAYWHCLFKLHQKFTSSKKGHKEYIWRTTGIACWTCKKVFYGPKDTVINSLKKMKRKKYVY